MAEAHLFVFSASSPAALAEALDDVRRQLGAAPAQPLRALAAALAARPRHPTRLAVIFDYQSGAHALQIDELELLRNGTRIAIDTHDGWTGSIDDDHAYSLAFTSAHTPGDSYTLRATVSGSGGGDSTGVLEVSVPGPVTDESFVGRYRRNSVVIGQHETLDLNADHTLQRHVNGSPVATYDGYSWDQTDGLLAIRDASGTIVSFHTLTGPDSFTTNDGRMDRLATSVVVAEWAQGLGLTAPDDAADADPDGDRLSNFLELALGTDPRAGDTNPTTSVFDLASSDLDFTFTRPRLHQTLGLNYTLSHSPDLAENSWNPVFPDTIHIVAHPNDPALEVVTFAAPGPLRSVLVPARARCHRRGAGSDGEARFPGRLAAGEFR